MDGLRQVAGIALLLMGLIGFVDRDRPLQARSRYYFWDPGFGPWMRAASGLALMAVGAVLLLA